ncbi:hypothetical protein [Albimonas pacifica]|uniref:Uncharacterized protein n=1 Tax=Albimonas pacifica TaxID=1114924 RepID=A0A1I3GDX5_9RHOB|nr:hypothetical protein [Albimonas pacifica]SFI21442.1 hypothetical protein SAMN05216258_105102 [Albimonas pacifica]
MARLRPRAAGRAGRIALPPVLALAAALPGGLLLAELLGRLLLADARGDPSAGAALAVMLLTGLASACSAVLGLLDGGLIAWQGSERLRLRALVAGLAALAAQTAILISLNLSGP